MRHFAIFQTTGIAKNHGNAPSRAEYDPENRVSISVTVRLQKIPKLYSGSRVCADLYPTSRPRAAVARSESEDGRLVYGAADSRGRTCENRGVIRPQRRKFRSTAHGHAPSDDHVARTDFAPWPRFRAPLYPTSTSGGTRPARGSRDTRTDSDSAEFRVRGTRDRRDTERYFRKKRRFSRETLARADFAPSPSANGRSRGRGGDADRKPSVSAAGVRAVASGKRAVSEPRDRQSRSRRVFSRSLAVFIFLRPNDASDDFERPYLFDRQKHGAVGKKYAASRKVRVRSPASPLSVFRAPRSRRKSWRRASAR